MASKKSIITAQQLAEQEAQVQQRVAQYLQGLDEGEEQCADAQHDPQALRQALERLQQQQAAMQALGRDRQVGTEPEAVVLKGHGPGYNVQTAVDAEHAIIVAHEVHAQAGDNNSLKRMGEAARQTL